MKTFHEVCNERMGDCGSGFGRSHIGADLKFFFDYKDDEIIRLKKELRDIKTDVEVLFLQLVCGSEGAELKIKKVLTSWREEERKAPRKINRTY